MVEVCVLTAGSPYGKYVSVQVFGWYTRAVVMVFVRGGTGEDVMERVLRITGGEGMGLVVVFLLCLLMVWKARKLQSARRGQNLDEVPYIVGTSQGRDLEGHQGCYPEERKGWGRC